MLQLELQVAEVLCEVGLGNMMEMEMFKYGRNTPKHAENLLREVSDLCIHTTLISYTARVLVATQATSLRYIT